MDALKTTRPSKQATLLTEPFHRWLQDDGADCLLFYRTDEGYLLRFPDFADFLVGADATTVTCRPVPSVDLPTCEYLFLNQVLPMMRATRGELVFHGSAVEVGGGAIGFLGSSGLGKSTLAASLALSGNPLLTEDLLVLDRGADDFWASPGDTSVRLWEDSMDALFDGSAIKARAVAYSDKELVFTAGTLPHCAIKQPLRAAFFLQDESASRAETRRLRGSDALASWMSNIFLLDFEDRKLLERSLAAVQDIATSVPSFTLKFPRDYASLPNTKRAILNCLEHHVQSREQVN